MTIRKTLNSRDDINHMSHEKEKEEDLAILRIMYMDQHKVSRDTLKRTKRN